MESKKYVYVVVRHHYVAWNLEHDVEAVFESKEDAEDYCDRAERKLKNIGFTFHEIELNKGWL